MMPAVAEFTPAMAASAKGWAFMAIQSGLAPALKSRVRALINAAESNKQKGRAHCHDGSREARCKPVDEPKPKTTHGSPNKRRDVKHWAGGKVHEAEPKKDYAGGEDATELSQQHWDSCRSSPKNKAADSKKYYDHFEIQAEEGLK